MVVNIHLGLSGGGAVIILDPPVREHLGHGDGAAGEVGVVVQALAHAHARGGVAVAQQQREHCQDRQNRQDQIGRKITTKSLQNHTKIRAEARTMPEKPPTSQFL
jgi:hypothetical protein